MVSPFKKDGMGGVPSLGGLPPGMTLADTMRIERQAAVFKEKFCLNGCPEGTEVSLNIPTSADPKTGVLNNVTARCLRCLGYYEITPNGEIVNVKNVVEEPGPKKKIVLEKA